MTTQEQMFPRTTLDLLVELAEIHRADYDKAVKALDALSDDEKIAKAYEKAEDRVAAARDLVAAIDQVAKRERERLTTTVSGHGAAWDAAVELKRNAEKAGIGLSFSVNGEEPVVITEAPTVDPITGEVAPAEVFAVYPGDDDPHATPVGDRTRYGELVADYFTAAGPNVGHSTDDWTVVAEDELTTTGGNLRKLRDVIATADYGRRLRVVAADQGSVTGAPAEKVATL